MFNNKSTQFLEKMLKSSSPSGFEEETGIIYKEYLSTFCDKTQVDSMGNITGIINETAKFKVMLAGHYDEIGFQVVHISDEGFIYFRKVGGIDTLTLPGLEVEIINETGKTFGVIGKKAIHLVAAKDRDKILEIKDLWIDIGASSKKEAEKLVNVGDPIAIKCNYSKLVGNKIKSKGMDDKIGAFVAAEVARKIAKARPKNIGFYCVGTVQEELGCRGAQTSAFKIEPNIAFAIDVGFATDTPDMQPKEIGVAKLGKGPLLSRNADENKVFGKIIRATCKKKNIPFQEDAGFTASGGTDSAVIQLSRTGVATTLVSIPNRYMHTSVEVVDMQDVKNAIALITETILSLDGTEVFIPF
ncbi:MAG: M42 family metallopeptidase [bacterium]|nr:M42 family metallopeptidase [bacterium]